MCLSRACAQRAPLLVTPTCLHRDPLAGVPWLAWQHRALRVPTASFVPCHQDRPERFCLSPWSCQIAEPEACDQMYESLARLHSNYYKHKYPRPRDTSFSGLSVEEYKLILSTDTLEEFKDMNKGMWKKLQEKFAPVSPEEKHKAWAQSLPRPRT
ncbi:ubiquinol-cytochrome c reductase complex assembly factor 2 isoform X1 [Rhinolophus sinicus]|uniref:ubiquinol-cytochrome c reductase complex assembly factor 2 isoform X1 n=1 Tax=Rhinolophus sinicus TaxID=89399 RepID=UPI003D7B1C8E